MKLNNLQELIIKGTAMTGWLSPSQISWLSQDQISWLSQDQIRGLSQDQIRGLSQDQIRGLSPSQISWLSQDQISWLSQDQIEVIDDIKDLGQLKIEGDFYGEIVNGDFYDQSTYGNLDDYEPECNTSMCYGGHWVNKAGALGYNMKEKYGYIFVATILHRSKYPDAPIFDFNSTNNHAGLNYGKMMSAFHNSGEISFKDWAEKIFSNNNETKTN